ncbi:MAG: NAD(P)-dependent oxidoreductase [Pseudomonadota bacterium]
MDADETVGFIGLGAMGFGMALNLKNHGFDVVGLDIDTSAMARFRESGGRTAGTLAEIGSISNTVMIMVVNGAQVEAVLNPVDGLLSTMQSGVVMVHATIALSELRPVAEVALAHGVTVIDCPVSGGITGANAGSLTILAGGDEHAFASRRPLLEAVASNITHLGPLGAGMVGKLANNLILGVGRLAIGEAFAMARRAGISTEELYRTLLTCTADSRQLRGLEAVILRGEYPDATFLGLKDLSAAVDSGRTVGQAMPVTGLTRELYQLIDDKLGGLSGSDQVMRYFLEVDGDSG